MSGILLKIIEPYKEGDMIQIKEFFGKVFHIGFLHTAVQTPFREVVSVPNLVAISDMIINYTKGGYLVNVDVSLGYDVPRIKVEKMLINAINKAGLKDSFVLVDDLGKYSVTYKAVGLIEDVSKIVSTRSRLRSMILDSFSKNNIEILTPLYISHKEIPYSKKIISKPSEKLSKYFHSPNGVKKPEEVMYEKADKELKKKQKEKADKKISQAFKKIIKQ
jgi:small-conductance mechanosensitive channel